MAASSTSIGNNTNFPLNSGITLRINNRYATPLAGRYDDLTRIQGISQQLASHLKALGIVTYRQVAEFTTDDMQHIQRIIGTERYQPPEGWVQNARALC